MADNGPKLFMLYYSLLFVKGTFPFMNEKALNQRPLTKYVPNTSMDLKEK
jgi:hypothetical protein